MINLRFEPNILLPAELELEINNLLLFTQIRDHRAQFRQLEVHIVACFTLARDRCCRSIGCLLNARGLGAHRLEMLMKNRVLSRKILTSIVDKLNKIELRDEISETYLAFRSTTS